MITTSWQKLDKLTYGVNSRFPRTFMFLLALSFSGILHATTVLPMDIAAMTQKAPVVAYGRVVEIRHHNPSQRRTAVVEIFELAKCPPWLDCNGLKDAHIPLHNRLSLDAKYLERVVGAPDFRVGESVLVYLEPVDNTAEKLGLPNAFSLVGFHQGKLRVLRDENGVRRVASHYEIPQPELSVQEMLKQRGKERLNFLSPAESSMPTIRRQELGEGRELSRLDAVLALARQSPPAPKPRSSERGD